MSTLAFFAVKEETRFFHPPPGCAIQITGMGSKAARSAAEGILSKSPPKRILTCGFAGALNPAFKIGTLAFDTEESQAASILVSLGAIPSRLHCLERVVVTKMEKSALRERTGADAVEMESGVIREICRERNIPATTLRVISDTAAEDLPLDFNALMTPDGKRRFGRLVKEVVFYPGRWPAMRRLQQNTTLAARRLGETLEELLRRLG